MRIVFVFADTLAEWNCSEFRCAIPARSINAYAKGHHADLVAFQHFLDRQPESEKLLARADAIVVERNLLLPALTEITRWRERGKKIIGDFDDAYHLLPRDNSAYGFWMLSLRQEGGEVKRIMPPVLTQFRGTLQAVDAVTCPSEVLLADWQSKTSAPGYYLPNLIETERYKGKPRPRSGRILIGWGGSKSHRHSFTGSGILEALRELTDSNPAVTVRVHGGEEIYDLLPVKASQKEFVGWKTYSAWPKEINEWDIALAPMVGAYDDRRSLLRMAEYTAAKVPFVASVCAAYAAPREQFPEAFTDNTAAAWLAALRQSIAELPQRRQRMATRGPEYAAPFGARAGLSRYLETYTAILDGQKAHLVEPDTEAA